MLLCRCEEVLKGRQLLDVAPQFFTRITLVAEIVRVARVDIAQPHAVPGANDEVACIHWERYRSAKARSVLRSTLNARSGSTTSARTGWPRIAEARSSAVRIESAPKAKRRTMSQPKVRASLSGLLRAVARSSRSRRSAGMTRGRIPKTALPQ